MLDHAIYFPYLAQFIHARKPCLIWEHAAIEQVEQWVTDIVEASDVSIHIYYPYGVIQTWEQGKKKSANKSLSEAIQYMTEQLYEYTHSTFVFIFNDPLETPDQNWLHVERCIQLAIQKKGSLILVSSSQIPANIQEKGIRLNDLANTIQSTDMKNNLSAGNPSSAFFAPIDWSSYPNDQSKSNEKSAAHNRRLQNFTNLINLVERINVGDVNQSSNRFDLLHRWLVQKRIHFKARDLQAPHGVLFLGQAADVQRQAAELVANTWSVPLYRIDMASIPLGDFEQQCGAFKDLLGWIEEKSPCIFWIDHVEIAFNTDSPERNQTHARFISDLLLWQQRRKSKTLAILTAQDILKIPVELLHKGGFDKIVHLDVWTEKERENVLRFLMGKHNLPQPSSAGMLQLIDLVQDLSSEDLKEVFGELSLQTLIQGLPNDPDQLYIKRFSDLRAKQHRRRG